MAYEKPLPKINSDNRFFWEGCGNHELRFQQCRDCGHVRWPPAHVCPMCHSTETVLLTSKGRGRVYTFAVYHAAFHPGFSNELPYTVAVVKLDEGPQLLTNIVGCPPDRMACDMPVAVVWEDVATGISLPKFTPLTETE